MSSPTLPDPTMRAAKYHLKSKLAAAVRDRKPQAEIDALRRDYYAAKLAEHITAEVAKAPPLTAEQRDQLGILLRGGAR